jgi:hypothetical protein
MIRNQTQCQTCRATFDERAWESLRLVVRIDAYDIARLILNWPCTDCIEVRNCSSCHTPLSVRCRVRPLAVVEKADSSS